MPLLGGPIVDPCERAVTEPVPRPDRASGHRVSLAGSRGRRQSAYSCSRLYTPSRFSAMRRVSSATLRTRSFRCSGSRSSSRSSTWSSSDGSARMPDERRAMRPLVVVGPLVMVVAAASLAHDYLGVELSSTGERGSCAGPCSSTRHFRSRSCSQKRRGPSLRRVMLSRLLAGLADGTVYDDRSPRGGGRRRAASASRRGSTTSPRTADAS